MRKGIDNTLTKDYLLSKVSQERIASTYLNIPIDTIINCIETGELICSPIRIDRHPTVGFAINNKGKLRMRDFNGSFWGDVFDIVAYILSFKVGRQININNKSDFYYVLKHISYTFRNIISGKEDDFQNLVLLRESIQKVKQSKPIIEIVTRGWTKQDKDIWGKWKIGINWLDTHFVVPVEQYYINRFCQPEPKYRYKANDPAYAYILGLDQNGIYNIEIYHPLRDRSKGEVKFITNTSCLAGLLTLDRDDYDIILITKSYKDNLAISNWLNRYPLQGSWQQYKIGVINVSSESYILKQNEYDYLNSKLNLHGLNLIVSFYDFDLTGIRGAKRLKKDYNIPYILIPNGKGLDNYGAKDFSELIETYSDEVINEMINETLELFNIEDYGERYNRLWEF